MNTDNEPTVIIPRQSMRQLVYGETPRSKGLRMLVAAMFFSLGTVGASVAFAAPAQPTDVQKSVSGQDGKIKVATCNDGKEYWATTNDHRFACAGHKGVASWADGSPVRAKAERKGTREYR